jgi:hypothetical protein
MLLRQQMHTSKLRYVNLQNFLSESLAHYINANVKV